MEYWYWKGIDIEGNSLEGAIEGELNLIQEQLGLRNIFQIEFVKISNKALLFQFPISDSYRIFSQMHQLSKSGMSIVETLEMISQVEKKMTIKFVTLYCKSLIQEGKSISESFLNFQCFPPIAIKLIQVAEETGTMVIVLQEISEYFEKQQKIVEERKKILTYPLVVSIVGGLLFLGILLFLIPVFENMFLGLGGELPYLTKVMLDLSDALRNHPFIWIIVGGVSVMMLKAMSPYFKKMKLWENVPIYTKIQKLSFLVLYSRSMAMLLKAGISFRETLQITESLFLEYNQQQLAKVHHWIENGHGITQSYQQHSKFPQLFIRIISIGENSGNLQLSYHQVAEIYENLLKKYVNRINTLLEPILILILAIGVLGILSSIYLPIFQMAEYM